MGSSADSAKEHVSPSPSLRCLPLTVTLHLSSFCNQIARVLIIVSSKIWLCATLNIPISAFPPPTSNIYATQLSLLHSYRSLLFTCRLWLWLMDRLQEGWFFRSNKQKEAICILASCSRRTCRRLHHSTLSLSLKTARTVVDKMCFYVGWEADMYITQKADLHIIHWIQTQDMLSVSLMTMMIITSKFVQHFGIWSYTWPLLETSSAHGLIVWLLKCFHFQPEISWLKF